VLNVYPIAMSLLIVTTQSQQLAYMAILLQCIQSRGTATNWYALAFAQNKFSSKETLSDDISRMQIDASVSEIPMFDTKRVYCVSQGGALSSL